MKGLGNLRGTAYAALGLAVLVSGSCSRRSESLNSMLLDWTGPYGGVPAWDKINPKDFPSAFDAAIAKAGKQIDAIAKNPEAPTFANTFVPMEKAGKALTQLKAIFDVHAANLNVGDMSKIESEVNPKVAAHSDRITQNSALFARIAKVYQDRKDLSAEQQRLVEDTYKSYVRDGATLGDAQKKQLSELNQKLSQLETEFGQNMLNDEEEKVTWIETEGELEGLTPALIRGFAKSAQDLGKAGKWAVRNTRSAMEPFLTFSKNRALREKVWKTYYSRGDNGDKNDNNAIISKILTLRAERAKLLGYETHAHVQLDSQMAKTPDQAMGLMMKVWPKALERAKEEIADMQALADAEGLGAEIEAWDYRYYTEKVRMAKYNLDSNQISEYLQLEKLIQAIHWMAQEVFELTFTRVTDVPVFHPDVTVYKVTDKTGNLVGLWYLDPYARDGKRSGAWMTDYRAQSNLDGKWVTPIVSNNSNFVKTEAGQPVLIGWDDAVTLFHEFGHALHGLSSRVTYPTLAGTNVSRDYVEFPSQLIEHWFTTREVLTRFAVHYQTGKPMPEELLAKIRAASKFNQGFATMEYLSAALVDMKLHLTTEAVDPRRFESETLTALGMPKQIVMRHRTPHFLHIFGHGYEAGYYSYLWADSLTADAADYFEAQPGGYYDKAAAFRLVHYVFSVGNTIDPAEGFRNFRGRDVDTGALMRKRGFE